MKNTLKIFLLFLLSTLSIKGISQTEEAVEVIEDNFTKSSFFLEGGANIPAFGWGSDYGYAKTGFEVGGGWDYYFFKRWGIGLDLRYHQNGISREDNTISTKGSKLYDRPWISARVNPTQTSGTWGGTSLAIGPTFRTPLWNDKFMLEAYIKGGVAAYRLPSLSATYSIIDSNSRSEFSTNIIDGYRHEKSEEINLKLFGITGVRFGYNLTDNWMVYATVNYKTTLIDRDDYYYSFDRTMLGPAINLGVQNEPIKEGTLIDGPTIDKTVGFEGFERETITRTGSIQSFGALIGVKWTPSFVKKPKKKREKPEVFRKADTVVIVKTDTVNLQKTKINVKVEDGPSGVIIPNADVALIDEKGNVVMTSKSDAFGMVSFDGVEPGNYTTKAMVYGKPTTIAAISKAEFDNSLINKTVLYEDLNFILDGRTMNLDTKKTISEVLVSLDDKTNKGTKQATSDQAGAFSFGLSPESDYQVMGSKNGLFTNTNKVSTMGLKRSQTLFVELELGLQNPCGKNIELKNIYYDLDKWFIREEAKVELNRVVAFMKENPEVMIELSSHTDCRSSDSYNKTLSQKRATAAVNYIVSQGANKAKINGVGYGESKLLNRCADGVNCSEKEHQVNRRTEVKVTCP